MQEHIVRYGEKSVYGRLYRPESKKKCPAVILSHGYNGIGADFERECESFAQNGYVAYALDFCGGSTRSKSSGASTDMTLMTEKEDLIAAVDNISSLDFVDSDRIFLLGGSQGGIVTALAAAELGDRIQGIILYFPAFCIPDNWRHRFDDTGIPETVEFWGLSLGRVFFTSMKELYPFEVIGNYKGGVLIIQGEKDSIVLVDDSQRAASIYENCSLTVLKNEGHGFSPEGTATAIALSLDFMKELM